MAQRRINIFGALIDTADLPEMVSHLMAPSRLLGNEFSVAAPDLMQISAGSCLLPDGVLVIESEVKYLVIPNSSLASDYTIIYQLEDTKTLGGSPAILRLISGTKRQSNFTDSTVLGWVRYPGGSVPLSGSMFIQPSPLRITSQEAEFYYTVNCPLASAVRQKSALSPQYFTARTVAGSPLLSNLKPARLEPKQGTDLVGLTVVEDSSLTLAPTIGQAIAGSGIPTGTVISGISASSLTLNTGATLTANNVFLTLPPLWKETIDYPENEACSRFVNISATSTSCTLRIPFTIPKGGQPRKLVTRLFVDFNCFATFSLNLRGNTVQLSPNGGLISNTGSLMTREFDIPSANLEWGSGGSAYINVVIEAQPSRGISIAYMGLTGEPTPFTLFT